MDCENCKRKNELIRRLSDKLLLSRMDRDKKLLEEAKNEVKKPIKKSSLLS